MLLEEVNQLIKPGYLPMETGYYRLSNGQMYIAALTRKYGRSSDWVERCFVNYFLSTSAFDDREIKKIRRVDLKSKGISKQYIGTSQNGEYLMGGNVHKFRMVFNDPSKYFDTSKFKEAKIGSVICGDTFQLDGTPEGCLFHIVRDTSTGCEIKTRAWLFHATEEMARLHLERFIAIGDVLDNIDKNSQRSAAYPDNANTIICKFCHSNQVIKNGTRIETQYWLCKKCGRSFVNNQALHRMKYPRHTISAAVSDYYAGNSLNKIRHGIEKKTSYLPSTSTVYEWIKKITVMALDTIKYYRPRVSKIWAIDEREIWLSGRPYRLTNILDTESRFILSTTLSISGNKQDIEALLNSTCQKMGDIPEEVLVNLESQKNDDIKVNRGPDADNIRVAVANNPEKLNNIVKDWLDTVTDRFKPVNGREINKGTQILLEGFAFHYNYIRLHDYLGKTPAQASGIDLPFTSWMDLVKE